MNTIRKRTVGYVAYPFDDGSVEWKPWHLFRFFKPMIFQRKKDAVDYYGTSIPVFKVEIVLSRPSKELPEFKVIK